MNRRATLKDVAALAGLSTATVARVIKGDRYISANARERVETALAASGYRVNEIARGLRVQRTATIGHLLQGFIPNPFFAGVALGVEQEAFARGSGVLTVNTEGDIQRERFGVETLIRRRVDAMIFTVALHEDNVRLAVDAGIPVVQVERTTSIKTAAVLVDNEIGAYEAVSYLLSLGRTRIAYIGADPVRRQLRPGAPITPDVEQERLDGYIKALGAVGLPIEDRFIALGDYWSPETGVAANDGYAWMHRFLDQEPRPHAVFVAADILAAGALQALNERGCRVPDDVSVIGFDDTYAIYLAPPLTTVAQPMVEMGTVAARIALDAAGDVTACNEVVKLQTRLVIRNSTGPVGPS